jgi:hypothetical protein
MPAHPCMMGMWVFYLACEPVAGTTCLGSVWDVLVTHVCMMPWLLLFVQHATAATSRTAALHLMLVPWACQPMMQLRLHARAQVVSGGFAICT